MLVVPNVVDWHRSHHVGAVPKVRVGRRQRTGRQLPEGLVVAGRDVHQVAVSRRKWLRLMVDAESAQATTTATGTSGRNLAAAATSSWWATGDAGTHA